MTRDAGTYVWTDAETEQVIGQLTSVLKKYLSSH